MSKFIQISFWIFCGLCCLLDLSYCAMFYDAHTEVGVFRGKIKNVQVGTTVKKNQIVCYLGIPYAKAQSGGIRFQRPVLHKALRTTYNATYLRPPCLQPALDLHVKSPSTEDCLHLNIYAPIASTVNPEKKYPVLIYFHGGDFIHGSPNDISPDTLSSAGELIVVTVSYRLGVLGFLNSGDYHAQGNYGLWDQHLAIKWVRYNILSFGGDVQKITLVGQTAGAASAMFQALYPGNRGLFQRIIAMSGSNLNPWSLGGVNLAQIGKKLGCVDTTESGALNNETVVQCINNKPAGELLKVGGEIKGLGPVIDGDFITDRPENILFNRYGNISDALSFFLSLDIIIGVNENDGDKKLVSVLASELQTSNPTIAIIRPDELEHVLVPRFLRSIFQTHKVVHKMNVDYSARRRVEFSVLFQYTNWTDPENISSIRTNLLRLSTDLNFAVPAVQLADAHSREPNRKGATYLYQFSHRPSYKDREPAWVKGAGETDETLFLFGLTPDMVRKAGIVKRVPKGEYELAENMIKWISNFANTGNPNIPSPMTGNSSFKWPLYNDTERPFLRFSLNMSTTSQRTRFNEPSTTFWTSLVPVLLRKGMNLFGTLPPPSLGLPDNGTYYTAMGINSAIAGHVITALLSLAGTLVLIIGIGAFCVCRGRAESTR